MTDVAAALQWAADDELVAELRRRDADRCRVVLAEAKAPKTMTSCSGCPQFVVLHGRNAHPINWFKRTEAGVTWWLCPVCEDDHRSKHVGAAKEQG